MNLFLIFLFLGETTSLFHFPWLLDFYTWTLYGMIFEAQKQNLNMTSQTVISWHNFPFSDEDTDVKALVKSWLQSQPEEDRRMLETFLEDHFYKALDWVLKQNEFVVETSLVGVVMNGLSHMHGVKVKAEFACCLIRFLMTVPWSRQHTLKLRHSFVVRLTCKQQHIVST